MKTDGRNLIGVLSDTHDALANLAKAIAFFNRKRVSMVVHCGDWISPFTLAHYMELQAPLYGVFGNNDGDKFRHLRFAQKHDMRLVVEDQLLVLPIAGRKIAVYHGDYRAIVDALIKCGEYDAVFHGHDHLPKVERVGNVLSLNPGTLLDYTSQEIQGASAALYDAMKNEGELVPLQDIDAP